MAEILRSDTPSKNPEYPPGKRRVRPSEAGAFHGRLDNEPPLPGMPTGSNLLPAYSPRTNQRLNRSAQAIGWISGMAVSTVRHFPRTMDDAKSRLHEVSGRVRQSASTATVERIDTIAKRASDVRDSAAEKVSELGEEVVSRASELAENVEERLNGLRRSASQGMQQMRAEINHRVVVVRQEFEDRRRQYPVQTIAAIGAAAFVAGALLRAWRSSDD